MFQLTALPAAAWQKYQALRQSLYLCSKDGSRCEVYLKREDLNHTGAHKINNSLGQVLLCLKMGKKRVIAETGAGQHGVATVSKLPDGMLTMSSMQPATESQLKSLMQYSQRKVCIVQSICTMTAACYASPKHVPLHPPSCCDMGDYPH